MTTSAHDEFYAKRSVPELMEKLLSHRVSDVTLDKEWYESLIAHLSKRELSDEQKIAINHYIETAPDVLKKELMANKETKVTTASVGSENIQKRYPALRLISSVYRILAYVIGIFGILGFVVGLSMAFDRNADEGIMVLMLSVLIGAIAFITFLAISEGIHVFIDIEENTRRSNSLLSKKL